MSFASIHFLLFFPTVLLVSWYLRRSRTLRVGFLVLASYYFYMSWNASYALLILGSTTLDFVVAKRMARSDRTGARRAWLVLSLAGNLGVLFAFKYYNFFLDSVIPTFNSLGPFSISLPYHEFLLPVGISFYTFQTLSYTIDVYRGTLKPTDRFLDFAMFVSFFPQLVAGPIVRASDFLPQIDTARPAGAERMESGLIQILGGLIKKLCLADMLGMMLVDPVFADTGSQSSLTLLVAAYGFAFQIYYDFCGYSDVAIGAARMLGFDLPINFDRPYAATSIRNFWCWWHISLSSWLRDYLYVALGGGRGSTLKTSRNLALVMVLGGLWHGAGLTYVVWGALHGMLLGAGRLFSHVTGINPDGTQGPFIRMARIALTFHLVAFCLVVFRADSLDHALQFGAGLLSGRTAPWLIPLPAMILLAIAAALEWLPRHLVQVPAVAYARLPALVQAGANCAILFLFAAVAPRNVPFIYFQF